MPTETNETTFSEHEKLLGDGAPAEKKSYETRGKSKGEAPTTMNIAQSPGSKGTTNMFMYCSHFLTKWGERMWTFAVGLFLIYINPETLQLTALYGLIMGASVLLLGPLVGDWVDNTQRLKAARVTLIVQTLFVVLCSLVIYFFLMFRNELLAYGEWTRLVTYAIIIILAVISQLANTANTITVEKDWIVEMCSGDGEKLATMTARMRGIDLTTQIMAPIATGQIMTFIGVDSGALFIAAWNVVTVILEYYLIWKVYKTIPALRNLKDVSKTVSGKKQNQPDSNADKNLDITGKRSCLRSCRMFSSILVIYEGWKTYAGYPVMLTGLALSCLFFTVLGFDNVTVGYAKIQGLSESILGIMMGAAGLLGIIGTFSYPFFRRKLGLPKSAMVALFLQLACLTLCLLSNWLPGSPFDPTGSGSNWSNATDTGDGTIDQPQNSLTSVLVLLTGIITARFGLWVADLSITQMFMQSVKEEERGIVFGVQNSLNQMMDMLKFCVVTALPLPSEFGFLVIISFTSMLFGDLLYGIFLCRMPRSLTSSKDGKDKGTYTQI